VEEQVSECTGVALMVALEQELGNIESFRELVRVHDELLANIETLSNRQSKAEKAGQALAIADIRRQLEEKRVQLHNFYKGLVLFSLPFYSRQRAATLRRLLAGLVCANHYAPSFSIRRSCVEFFSKLDMAASSAVLDTSRMLEQLFLRPLPAIEYSSSSEDVPAEGPLPRSVFPAQAHFAHLLERAMIISIGGTPATASYNLASTTSASFPPETAQSSAATEDVAPATSPAAAGLGQDSAKGNPLAQRRMSAVLQSRGAGRGGGGGGGGWVSSPTLPSSGSADQLASAAEDAGSAGGTPTHAGGRPAQAASATRRVLHSSPSFYSSSSSSAPAASSGDNEHTPTTVVSNERVQSILDDLISPATSASSMLAAGDDFSARSQKKPIWGD
jgi:hypothetical protein